jgi:hypothetical protein
MMINNEYEGILKKAVVANRNTTPKFVWME